jgi:hypothetical protein
MNSESAKPVVITPARSVLLPVANAMTGYWVKAIQCKIHRGEWEEGKAWRRAPDGRIFIDIGGFERWVGRRACSAVLAQESPPTAADDVAMLNALELAATDDSSVLRRGVELAIELK